MKKSEMMVDAVVTLQRTRYNTAQPVRLLDVQVWRQEGTKFREAIGERPRTVGYTGVVYGYPVLTVSSPYKADQAQTLFASTATLKSLLNADDTLNKDAVPAGLTVQVVNASHLRGDWAAFAAEQAQAQIAEKASQDAYAAARQLRQSRFQKLLHRLRTADGGPGVFGTVHTEQDGRVVTMPLAAFEALVNGVIPE